MPRQQGVGDGEHPGQHIVPLCGALLDVSSSFPHWWQEEPAHDFLWRHVASDLGPLLLHQVQFAQNSD